MSGYIKYDTEAIVVSVYKVKESDVSCTLFTRELGLISVRAQGVRTMRSKLRYGLTKYSRSKVAVVRGKGGWRITNCYPIENLYSSLCTHQSASTTMARVLALCGRLLDEGRGYEELYDTVVSGFVFMGGVKSNTYEVYGVERMIVLRVLYMLGYVQSNNTLLPFLKNYEWGKEYLDVMHPVMKKVTYEINHSLMKSGL